MFIWGARGSGPLSASAVGVGRRGWRSGGVERVAQRLARRVSIDRHTAPCSWAFVPLHAARRDPCIHALNPTQFPREEVWTGRPESTLNDLLCFCAREQNTFPSCPFSRTQPLTVKPPWLGSISILSKDLGAFYPKRLRATSRWRRDRMPFFPLFLFFFFCFSRGVVESL